jgi:hypothetical protein
MRSACGSRAPLPLFDFRRNHAYNTRRYLILKVEHVRKRTVDFLRPQMDAGRRLNQLPSDPQP